MGKFGNNRSDIERLKALEKSGELLKTGDLVMYSINWVYGIGYNAQKDGPILHGIVLKPDTSRLEAEDDDRKYWVHWLGPNRVLSYPWCDLQLASDYLISSKS
mgnify:FL=1|jgi:hypothetical protein|tara:strand:+ start:250 stop:558 length:309 start_codon:yes stop_codon:yes gene_type:complete